MATTTTKKDIEARDAQMTMHAQIVPAYHILCAIRAARNRRVWGRWATARYLARRGVPLRLYQIAIALEGTA